MNRYISVEGPIGVGKTGLVNALKERMHGKLITDTQNPFLPAFYQDMEKYAFQVQIFFLLSRFQQQKELAQGDLFSTTTICDYLFHKDRLFASLILNAQEFSLYEKIYGLLKGTIVTPDVVIYMQASVDTLLERISHSSQDLALLLPRSYMENLVEAYQTFFFHYSAAPVIVVNADQKDFWKDPKVLDLLIQNLSKVKAGLQYFNV